MKPPSCLEGYEPFLHRSSPPFVLAKGGAISWERVVLRDITSKPRLVRLQEAREKLANDHPLGLAHLINALTSLRCPLIKAHLKTDGVVVFLGALHKERLSGTVCVPILFEEQGVGFSVEMVSLHAYVMTPIARFPCLQ